MSALSGGRSASGGMGQSGTRPRSCYGRRMTWSPDADPDPLLTSWKPTASITITCRTSTMTAEAERRGRLFTIGGVLPPEFDDYKRVHGLPVSVTTIHGSAAR